MDGARLAVDKRLRRADGAAESLHDRLVTEADAERGHACAQPFDQLDRDAGARRHAGTGGDDEMRWGKLLGLLGGDRVVALHDHLGAELAEQVRQVVGEGVVVINQQNHCSASASSIAASTAASLFRHSSCSEVGSESATNPAPACRWATPPESTSERMAMQVSKDDVCGSKYPTAPA